MAPVLVEHGLQIVGRNAQLIQLGSTDAAAGVTAVLADGDEAKEGAASGLSSLLVELDVDRLGAPADRARQAAGFLERGECDHVALPGAKSSAIVCCTSGQRARLNGSVGRDALDQLRLDVDADALGRKPHGLGELGVAHRSDRHRSALDGVADARVGERPVEVVGAQRRHDADDARRTAGGERPRSSSGTPAAHGHRWSG